MNINETRLNQFCEELEALLKLDSKNKKIRIIDMVPEISKGMGHIGIAIYCKHTLSFNPGLGKWDGEDKEDTVRRYFEICSRGIVKEVYGTDRPEALLGVFSPRGAHSFFLFLANLTSKSLQPSKDEVTPLDRVIESIYVPFYRDKEDLSRPLKTKLWVNIKPLKKLLIEHFKAEVSWMSAPYYDKLLASHQKQIDDIPPEGRMDEDFGGGIRHLSAEEIKDDLNDYFYTVYGKYVPFVPKCAAHAIKINDKHILKSGPLAKTLEFNFLYSDEFMGSEPKGIPVRVLLRKDYFPAFFDPVGNPIIHELLMAIVAKKIGLDESIETWQPSLTKNLKLLAQNNKTPKINLPSYNQQAKIAFETRHYLLQIDNMLINDDYDSREDCIDYRKRYQKVTARYHLIERITGAQPSDEFEFARASQPLPYFLERPILHWETATAARKYAAGCNLLNQILKTSCLFALEELHSIRSNISQLQSFPKGLLEKMMGKPSTGIWNQGVDHLFKLNGHFSVWKQWLEVVYSEKELIALIEDRNKFGAHPNYLPTSENKTQEALAKMENVLGRLIPKLRTASKEIEIILPQSRKLVTSDDAEVSHQISYLDLKTARDPFSLKKAVYDKDKGNQINEDELYSIKGATVVPLKHFFVTQVEGIEAEVYIYNDSYGKDGSAASLTGITNTLDINTSMQQGAFSFGC